MIDSTKNTVGVLNAVDECIKAHVEEYLTARLQADLALPDEERNYEGHLPTFETTHRGTTETFNVVPITPSYFIDLESTQFDEMDAADTYNQVSIVNIRIVISSADIQTDNAAKFQNAISTYSEAVIWTLMRYYDEYGCKAGAFKLSPVSSPFSPAIQVEGYSQWIRTADIKVEITHRISQRFL